MRCARLLPLVLVLMSACATVSRAQRPADRLDWLAGCWARTTRSGLVEEQWMAPRGGQVLGMSRTVRGDTVREWEFLRIYASGDTLVYAAIPSGQSPAEFRMTWSAAAPPRELRFENVAHDFPQRIIYRAVGADSLIARVEGTRDGQRRGLDFPYRRATCAN